MSTSQRAVTPCGLGVNAGMVHVWMVGTTVWSPCYTRIMSEHFRDKRLIIKRYINSPVFTLLHKLRCKGSIEKLDGFLPTLRENWSEVNFHNQQFKNILQHHIHRHFTSKSAAQNKVKRMSAFWLKMHKNCLAAVLYQNSLREFSAPQTRAELRGHFAAGERVRNDDKREEKG